MCFIFQYNVLWKHFVLWKIFSEWQFRCRKKCRFKKKLSVKFVSHNYICILCADFFMNWFWEANGVSCDVFQSTYIWLIETKLVLTDNWPTKFRHSAILEMKHAKLHANYTFFSWTSRAHYYEIMYNVQVYKINSLTSVANNNTMAGPIWDVLKWQRKWKHDILY